MEVQIFLSVYTGTIEITNHLNESFKIFMRDGESFQFKFTGYRIIQGVNEIEFILVGYDDEGFNKFVKAQEIEQILL
jgi:hypothetical protein